MTEDDDLEAPVNDQGEPMKVTVLASGATITEIDRPPLPEVPEPRRITPYAFKARLLPAERMAIRAAAAASGEVADFVDMLDSARYVDLDLVDDVRTPVVSLEVAGLLGVGRAAVVLDSPVQESERP